MYKNTNLTILICSLLFSLSTLSEQQPNVTFISKLLSYFKPTQLPTEIRTNIPVSLDLLSVLTPTQMPNETITDQPISINLSSLFTPNKLPDMVITDEPTLKKRAVIPSSIENQSHTIIILIPSIIFKASPTLELENSTTRWPSSIVVTGSALAAAAVAYLASSQFSAISTYGKLDDLINNIEQQISEKAATLSDQQLQDLKAAIQVARNVMNEFSQDSEKLTTAYNALMLEAQKYSVVA